MNIFLDLSDKRNLIVKNKLKEKDYCCFDFGENSVLKEKDVLVLSPAFKMSKEFAGKLINKIFLVCGKVEDEVKQIFEEKDIKYFNLMEDETFVLKNATLTAEGFLADIILNTQKSIFNQKFLILGGGRVCKAVALMFYKLGVSFDVTTRKEEKLLPFQLLADNIVDWNQYRLELKNYDCVVNTIPAELFTKQDESLFKDGAVLFELASKKCLNKEAEGGVKYVLCPALPSKYTPESAGILIFEYLQKLFEKGEIK